MPVEVGLQRPSNWLRTVILNAAVGLTRLTGLQRLWRPIDHPGERSPDSRVSPVSEDVLRHGTMRHGLEPGPVQGGEQHTGITVTYRLFVSTAPSTCT